MGVGSGTNTSWDSRWGFAGLGASHFGGNTSRPLPLSGVSSPSPGAGSSTPTAPSSSAGLGSSIGPSVEVSPLSVHPPDHGLETVSDALVVIKVETSPKTKVAWGQGIPFSSRDPSITSSLDSPPSRSRAFYFTSPEPPPTQLSVAKRARVDNMPHEGEQSTPLKPFSPTPILFPKYNPLAGENM